MHPTHPHRHSHRDTLTPKDTGVYDTDESRKCVGRSRSEHHTDTHSDSHSPEPPTEPMQLPSLAPAAVLASHTLQQPSVGKMVAGCSREAPRGDRARCQQTWGHLSAKWQNPQTHQGPWARWSLPVSRPLGDAKWKVIDLKGFQRVPNMIKIT